MLSRGALWRAAVSTGRRLASSHTGHSADYVVAEESDWAALEKAPFQVGRYQRPKSDQPYNYDGEKYRNAVSLLGRVHGKVYYNVANNGSSFATFLLSTKKVAQGEAGGEARVFECVHRVQVWREGLVRLLKERNMGGGCRLLVNGSLTYYQREVGAGEEAAGLGHQVLRTVDVSIVADDLFELHSKASLSAYRDPAYQPPPSEEAAQPQAHGSAAEPAQALSPEEPSRSHGY